MPRFLKVQVNSPVLLVKPLPVEFAISMLSYLKWTHRKKIMKINWVLSLTNTETAHFMRGVCSVNF